MATMVPESRVSKDSKPLFFLFSSKNLWIYVPITNHLIQKLSLDIVG